MALGDLELGFFALVRWLAFGYAADQVERSEASPWGKRGWILIVFFLPLLGALIWWLFGPRAVETGNLEDLDPIRRREQVTEADRQGALRTLKSKEWR